MRSKRLDDAIGPMLELVLAESPAELGRALDEETRLPLIRIEPEEDETP